MQSSYGVSTGMLWTATVLSLSMLQTPAAQPADDYAQVFTRSANALRQRYYARVSRGKELEDRLKAIEVRASAAKSREDFANIMNTMIGEFKDSHFEFMTLDSQGYYLMDGLGNTNAKELPNVGAWFSPAADGYTVKMVLDGGAAKEAGLRKGDVILKIDREPFTPVASLRTRVGKEANFTYRRNGKELEAKMSVSDQPALQMFLDATMRSAHIIESGGKKIGYVHLWTQASDKFIDTLHRIVLSTFRDTDGIILDIRDGFGGRPERYMDPFFRPEVNLEWKYSENGPSARQLYGNQRPLVVLINKGSRSAKEVLAQIIKKSKRATLIGNNTAGDVLGTSPFKVADWAYLEIPMVDLTVDGIRLERVGVAPDIKVDPEYDADGKDLVIERALSELNTKLGSAR